MPCHHNILGSILSLEVEEDETAEEEGETCAETYDDGRA
jgi:hypothetical protein